MKEFLTTILLLISASSIAQTSLELSFSKEDFHISNGELIMISTNLKERRVIGDTLSPCLPYFPYRIIVPENINSVFLSIECSKNIVAENRRQNKSGHRPERIDPFGGNSGHQCWHQAPERSELSSAICHTLSL